MNVAGIGEAAPPTKLIESWLAGIASVSALLTYVATILFASIRVHSRFSVLFVFSVSLW
jgi:hypothetical protein